MPDRGVVGSAVTGCDAVGLQEPEVPTRDCELALEGQKFAMAKPQIVSTIARMMGRFNCCLLSYSLWLVTTTLLDYSQLS